MCGALNKKYTQTIFRKTTLCKSTKKWPFCQLSHSVQIRLYQMPKVHLSKNVIVSRPSQKRERKETGELAVLNLNLEKEKTIGRGGGG